MRTKIKNKDMIGMLFGLWTVTGISEIRKDNRTCFNCLCECGKERVVQGNSLKCNRSTGCGCSSEKNIVGERFGMLVIRSVNKDTDPNKTTCVCDCDCGETKVLLKNNVKSGGTRSCGCLSAPSIIGQKINNLTVLEKSSKKYEDKKTRHLCVCDCGKTTLVRSGDLKRGHTRSCGCLHNVSLPSGKDHHAWNPEITDEDRKNRRDRKKVGRWSSQIFERDNHTCKLCKIRGGVLNAHHLDGWHWCVERRYDLENGVTLCEICHRTFHKIYGNRDNTAEEFFEFFLCSNHSN